MKINLDIKFISSIFALNKKKNKNMKTFEVTLFVLGLPYNENNTRVVTIEANSQDEAEQKAHDWYISDGWGVYDSKEITE